MCPGALVYTVSTRVIFLYRVHHGDFSCTGHIRASFHIVCTIYRGKVKKKKNADNDRVDSVWDLMQ
jgi:hypothetical protein